MFLNEEKDEDHKMFIFFACLSFEDRSAPWTILPKKRVSWNYAMVLGCIQLKKNKSSHTHTAAYNFPNKMSLYEPTTLITEHKSHRTMAGLCEKENCGLPLNPITPWMCCIKINQGHHYSFSLWFGLPSNYILCISEITAPPPLTEFDITLINVSFQNERQKCQIPTIINSFNSLICIK